MLFLLPGDGRSLQRDGSSESSVSMGASNIIGASSGVSQISAAAAAGPSNMSVGVVEDEVDKALDKEDGKIYRERNEQL